MWRVSSLDIDGSRRELTVVQSKPGEPFHSRLFLETRLAPYRAHLVALLEAQALDPALAFGAIETWAEEAELMADDYDWADVPRLRRLDTAIARYPDDDSVALSARQPLCMAWHDRTGVLVPMTGQEEEISIEYIPEHDDEIRCRQLLHRHSDASADFETLIDWRAFVGGQTAVIDGWTSMRRSGKGYIASIRGTMGYLVMTALRRISRPEPTFTRDRRWQSRLYEMERRYPFLAEACPSLHDVEYAVHDEALVFVHGTLSCGMVSLKDLFSLPVEGFAVPGPVYRFEHDTYLPVTDNSAELVALVEAKLRIGRRLVFVAHSRGGLVATDAAQTLAHRGFRTPILVRTFGTPFRGTPLVAYGKKALAALSKLGEEIATVAPVPFLSPLAKAITYVWESPTLPKGIMAMHEEAEGLLHLQRAASRIALESWGSSYDVQSGNAGFGASVEGILLAALRGQQNDLVVPMASALACGIIQPLLQCSHVHYFRQPVAKNGIDALLRGVPAVIPEPIASPVSRQDGVVAPSKASFKVIRRLRLKRDGEESEPPA